MTLTWREIGTGTEFRGFGKSSVYEVIIVDRDEINKSVLVRYLEDGEPYIDKDYTFTYHLNTPFNNKERIITLISYSESERNEDSLTKKKYTPWSVTEMLLESPVKRILLYGPPGTGKTSAANKVGAKKKDDIVYNITLTEETPAAELRGFYHIVNGNFEWVDGPATKAFRNGYRLVLNEIDHASGDTHTFLLNLLDDPDIAAITLPTEETVRPHSDFRCVATMNGHPTDLPIALRDRFSVNLEIPEPHPGCIQAMPTDIRGMAEKTSKLPDLTRRISPRQWFAFDEARGYLKDEQAAAVAVFGERANDILDAIKIERATTE